jgi:hypothetical protein
MLLVRTNFEFFFWFLFVWKDVFTFNQQGFGAIYSSQTTGWCKATCVNYYSSVAFFTRGFKLVFCPNGWAKKRWAGMFFLIYPCVGLYPWFLGLEADLH